MRRPRRAALARISAAMVDWPSSDALEILNPIKTGNWDQMTTAGRPREDVPAHAARI